MCNGETDIGLLVFYNVNNRHLKFVIQLNCQLQMYSILSFINPLVLACHIRIISIFKH